MIKLLFSLILILSFSIISFAQEVESKELPNVVVPNQAMEQVVRRVLIWSFKPRKQSKIIYLAEQGLEKSWLPSIKNIDFKLLSIEDIHQRKISVYFFTKPERAGNEFNIGFGFGNADCESSGDGWVFRISKQRIKLWQNGFFSSSCNS